MFSIVLASFTGLCLFWQKEAALSPELLVPNTTFRIAICALMINIYTERRQKTLLARHSSSGRY